MFQFIFLVDLVAVEIIVQLFFGHIGVFVDGDVDQLDLDLLHFFLQLIDLSDDIMVLFAGEGIFTQLVFQSFDGRADQGSRILLC